MIDCSCQKKALGDHQKKSSSNTLAYLIVEVLESQKTRVVLKINRTEINKFLFYYDSLYSYILIEQFLLFTVIPLQSDGLLHR